jgi:cell division protein FtsQ
VSTSFPSTVTITIVERAPVGYLRSGSDYRLIDGTGVQYATVHAVPAGLPLLVLSAGSGQAQTARSLAEVAAALPASLLPKIQSVQAMNTQSITLVVRGGRLVEWGTAAQSAAKARILPTLLALPAQQIDVSNPAQPFTR